MRILITGGTGLIGKSAQAHLTAQGHAVRILSRHAADHAAADVDTWAADVTDPDKLTGAATDCDVVLHIAGIAVEAPPELTFERVNVEGTQNMVSEAARAGVRRFVYVSSLGADHGSSEYHASKRAGEAAARSFPGECVIARPGGVYGPGHGVIARLVNMTRALPVLPVIDDGDQKVQPVWHDDVGRALAQACVGAAPAAVLELAGPDVLTLNQLFDLFDELTNRAPRRVSVPSGLLGMVSRFTDKAGIDIGVTPDVLQMLLDGNYIRDGNPNGLTLLGVEPTPLREGLTRLLNELPEQGIADGFGKAQHRRVRVAVTEARLDRDQLFRKFVDEWQHFLAVDTDVEAVTSTQLCEGAVLSLALPLRGNISVRVLECARGAITLAALDGHPLAGIVRFTFDGADRDIVFEVNVYDRPASLIDTVGMALGGSYAQRQAWQETARRVAEAAGGHVVGDVEHEVHDMTDEEVAATTERVADLTDPGNRGRSA